MNLASADRTLGTAQGTLQSGRGSALSGIDTNVGYSPTNNSTM